MLGGHSSKWQCEVVKSFTNSLAGKNQDANLRPVSLLIARKKYEILSWLSHGRRAGWFAVDGGGGRNHRQRQTPKHAQTRKPDSPRCHLLPAAPPPHPP